jgi:putative DNA primase/helicase
MATINILNDGSFDIAFGRSRKETNWKNKELKWSELVERLSTTHRTAESHNEYLASKKGRQDEIKDIGGFVGGYLSGGRRKAGSVVHRQVVTLDIDFAKVDMWEEFTFLYSNAAAIYSTHKHSPESPRYRLIIPLDRPVFTDEYMAISRRIAGMLGIDNFDHTTFQPERLMYWPSTSKDGTYVFEYQDGEWLNADAVLATYRDWKDSSEWPVGDREGSVIGSAIKKQGDPLEKLGVVGAFCRTYTITEVIEAFLSDVYDACDIENRYTYKEGSTSGGLVVYEDKYAYSHHGTDPTSGKLCNAFDLVRLHKFGLKDEDAREGTPGNKLPSFIAMEDFCTKDPNVRKQLSSEKIQSAKGDFQNENLSEDENLEGNDDWMSEMDIDRKGNLLSTRRNFKIVLMNDPHLKNKFALDLFSKRKIIVGNLPWRKVKEDTRNLIDEDECDLRIYLADKPFELSHNSNLKDAFDSVSIKQTVHPVKEYLSSLAWDGNERLDNLFIEYMGAADNAYTRAVTRKSLAAAVARIFQPGIKFDSVLTLVGEEGKQKSTIFKKLAKQWFSDTFSFKMLDRGKEAFEQLQGYWIIEIGELSGLRKAAIESVKQFLTKTDDVYRIPHKQYTSQFKRQCIFFGSTNEWDFLQGHNGNRRFWPVPILVQAPVKDIAKDLTENEIDQIWAEAIERYKKGETLFLSPEVENLAKEMQKGHTEKDDRVGAIEKYLETLLPVDWDDLDLSEKTRFIQGDVLQGEGTVRREKVCVAEIWCELFGGHVRDLNSYNTKSIHAILRSLKGWQKSTLLRFKNYGAQTAYVRSESAKTGAFSVNADGSIAVNGKQ